MLQINFYSDTIICVDNKEIRTHRVVLASHSEYFEALFDRKMVEGQENRLAITDFEFDTIRAMIEFMYTGSIPQSFSASDLICFASS